tara:strand:+ start:12717 stop:13574 length:858 start_codon:yes stop_codon:yes gene_type:complete
MIAKKISGFIGITRLDKPIGIYLLLWPALIALLISSDAFINYSYLIIIIVGSILVRSTGCVINDIFDMEFDKQVKRTKDRPLASGQLSKHEAYFIFLLLSLFSLLLVSSLGKQALLVCLFFAIFIVSYPLTKRFLKIPQVFLGVTFGSCVPIVFSMNEKLFDVSMWILYLANFFWIVAYDSFYAMSDYGDDKKLGVNSSITYWEEKSQNFIILFQSLSIIFFIFLGYINDLSFIWYLAIFFAVLLFYYQHLLARNNQHLKAFKNNNFIGLLFLLALLIEKYNIFI